ncbi:MAG: hypothetical protein JNM72_28175 [Deltaproteobacteria bacterium]|nr:hypothetical protein [Deltaproteobacteria bacterium]
MSTRRSALAALSLLLAPAAAHADVTFVDPQTFDWEVDSIGDGSINDGGHGTSGRSDSYDNYGKLCINPSTSFSATFPTNCSVSGLTLYTSTTETLSADSREVTMSALSVTVGTTPVSVQRRAFVPGTGTVGYLRYLDSFTNTGTTTVTLRVSIGAITGTTGLANGSLGSDSNTVLRSTSSGDALLTTDDTWVTTDDSAPTTVDPSLGFVWWGTGGALAPSTYTFTSSNGGQLTSSYLLTIPAGQTVRLLTFLTQRLNDAAAATSTALIAGLGVEGQLSGISDSELTEVVNWEFDADGDGASVYTDCDDTNAAINPSAVEDCDGVDNDCDGDIDEAGATGEELWYADDDGDGFGGASGMSCAPPPGSVSIDGDCDDSDLNINPDADEVCDAQDNDCDGDTDESGSIGEGTWYLDGDGDGFGTTPVMACEAPPGVADVPGDCDDAAITVNPGAVEVCDLVDNDCDGTVDGPTSTDLTTFFVDNDRDGFGGPSTAAECSIRPGLSLTGGDCDDGRILVNPAADERCATAFDDDCDGTVNEATATDALTWYRDGDTDGYGDLSSTTRACTLPLGYSADSTDCDDGRAATNPGATEYCNTFDDDCDTVVDEPDAADARLWYRDVDGDSFGTRTTGLLDVRRDCAQPTGYADDNTDCDDAVSSTYPGATEVCDSVDQDCDGLVDNDASDALTTYRDADSDGAGDPALSRRECSASAGYVTAGTDCDDTRAYVAPGAAELCDGLDDDCDGALGALEQDNDSDAFVECLPDAVGWQGALTGFGDCDDAQNTVYPGAEELEYDGVDQDCDGADLCDVDEDGEDATDCGGLDCDDLNEAISTAATERFYDGVDDNCDPADDNDFDGDGYASATYGGTDCDDARDDVYPGAPDAAYDGLITDCDDTDEYDVDGDGFASADFGGSDCDDANSGAHPEAEELWYDGLDQDCDGNDADQDRDGVLYPTDCADTDPAVYPNAPGYDEDCLPVEDDTGGADGNDGADGTDGTDGEDVEVDTGALAAGPEGNFVGGSGKVGCATAPRGPLSGLVGLLSGALALLGLRRRR